MIFLDTPIGTGFSYADHGETLVRAVVFSSNVMFLIRLKSRTEDAAVDVAVFFAILSESFPQLRDAGCILQENPMR
jgi:carboxypeptidase C (cathepsin A)